MYTLRLDDASDITFVPREVIMGNNHLGYTVDMESYENVSIGTQVKYSSYRYTVVSFFRHKYDDALCVELTANNNDTSWDIAASANKHVYT